MKEPIYKCPVCNLVLTLTEKSFSCLNKHAFDLSKNGYLNLILANQKKSKNPGDSKEMLLNRKEFLNKGHYKPLLEKIALLITNFSDISTKANANILDLGCGEGYYISGLKKIIENNNNNYYGLDVSKEAIILSAKRDKEVDFVVGNAFLLPFIDNSFEAIFSIFSPINIVEVSRILKTKGLFISVTPEPKHLFDLVKVLYDNPTEHKVTDKLADNENFKLTHKEELNYILALKNDTNNDELKNLVMMTPYFWQVSTEKQNKLFQLTELNVEVAFKIEILVKN
jgi:23S rRNA (guanine745-N1)-methyltransferase